MAIWKRAVTIGPISEADAAQAEHAMGAHLGLRIVEIGEDYLRGTLPVDDHTRQPFGLLHGGASCVLAEELGSVGANLCIAPDGGYAVGLEINANHLRSATDGIVTGTARPLHIGRNTQVWEIHIEDEQQRLVCVSRLTVAVKRSDGVHIRENAGVNDAAVEFALHPQLAADCFVLGDAPLCRLLLMNDAQYPWCILVPRRPDIQEIYQLAAADRAQLLDESVTLGAALMQVFAGNKLNVAALGNQVPQLHLHHIARRYNDPAWPAPVWGLHPAQAYAEDARTSFLVRLSVALPQWLGGRAHQTPPTEPQS